MGEQCGCMCHVLGGGPFHAGKRCICNGGDGYDDMSTWIFGTMHKGVFTPFVPDDTGRDEK